MSNSTNLQLPYLAAGQAQKHVTVNETLLRLDALVQLAVVSATTTAEPGSPSDGQVYILPAGKTGTNWGAMTNLALAYYRDGVWEEITPREGFVAYVKDTDALVAYSGSAWAGVGGGGGLGAATDAEARAQTSTTTALTPANMAGRATFSAHKNGTNQTGIANNTATKLTWSTEAFDVGGYFASDKWTPPAGKVRLSWGVQMQALSTYGVAMLYKNGARLADGGFCPPTSGVLGSSGSVVDSANGTDYYEIYALGDTASTITARGAQYQSYFSGEQI